LRGDHGDALEDYRQLRVQINSGLTKRVLPTDVVGSLVDRHDALLVAGDMERALDYIRLAGEFAPGRAPSADVLLRMATTARALADATLSNGGDRDPEYRTRAARLLKSAGDWFTANAEHPDTNRESAEGWADAMLLAGDCYERAGRTPEALRAFRQFVEGRPEGDLRRAEAIFRVATLLHAEGALDEAAGEYARVVEAFPGSPLAGRATVPLARCLEATGRRADAIARLGEVVDGNAGLKPDAAEYREALLELARLIGDEGDLVRASSLYDEALRRFPQDRRVPQMRFHLGECRRGLARQASQSLAESALAPSQRAAIDTERRGHLEAARSEFEQVVAALDGRPAESLDPLERDALRLATLYRADCLFDLGRLREAIELYEIAERRYASEAVSMVALIQIVNAWHALGDAERAATSERRAEIRLTQLPDSAFLDSGSIFSRDAWERWLRSSPPGPQAVAVSDGLSSGTGVAGAATDQTSGDGRE
jgi:tetratricopeptide (TPR) repeat protein